MADPSGAAPQPGPYDTSTAILRPKKSYVKLAYPIDTADALQAKSSDCR
jgi:transitional endoplasmic reticulum ATPase